MRISIISIAAFCAIFIPGLVKAGDNDYHNHTFDEVIAIGTDSVATGCLDKITISTADTKKFGAFVYMPSLHAVNSDGSIGEEISACEMIETSSRGKRLLQFRVQQPPTAPGKYAFIIKSNSFSVIPDNHDADNYNDSHILSRKSSNTSGCSFKNYPVNLEKDTLRILHISNSYGKDLLYYINDLLKAAEVDVSNVLIERLRYTNGSFKCWNDVFKDENTDTYGCYHMAGGLNINVPNCEGGKYDGSKFRMILDNPWDLIILNQASTYAPYSEEWNSNGVEGGLPELLSIIREYNPEVPIGFLLIHSYAEDFSGNTEDWTAIERWEKIRDGVEWLKTKYNIDFIIPYGTAIQNLRVTEYNNDYELTRDKTHLSNGLAKYTAGCCYYETVFSPRYKESVWGNSFRVPHDEEDKAYEIEVDDASAQIGQKAAFLASHNMYEIRNPELCDLTDYVYGEELNQKDYCFIFELDAFESVSQLSNCQFAKPYCIYGPTGIPLRQILSDEDWMKLPKGLYIVNGEKIYKNK